jgi:hypothetical protein
MSTFYKVDEIKREDNKITLSLNQYDRMDDESEERGSPNYKWDYKIELEITNHCFRLQKIHPFHTMNTADANFTIRIDTINNQLYIDFE